MAGMEPPPTLTPDDVRLITLEDLKLISDPLRAHLVEALVQRPATVKALAAQFGLPPTRLYYHVHLLEKHGFIRVVHTEIVSGIIEKHYRAAARQFRVDRQLFTRSPGEADTGLEAILAFVLDATRADIQKSAQAGRLDLGQAAPHPKALFIKRGFARFTPAQARRFYKRLQGLLKAFTESPDEGGQELYALALAFYPTDYHIEEADVIHE